MITGLTPTDAQFLANLQRIQTRSAKAQRELSSGLRVERPSDDPDQLASIIQASADLDRVEQVGLNLARVKGEVDTAEESLGNAVSMLDTVITLGAQGATSTQTAEQRTTLQTEVEGIMERLVAVADVTYENRNIFSGDADSKVAYQVDWTQANGVSAYGGSQATRKTEHPAGFTFAIAKSGDQIFDNPGSSVFQAVADLRNALKNNYQDGILAGVDAVKKAQTYLNQELSFYGSVQRSVADATDFASQQSVRLQTTLSGLRDADLTTSILQLNNASVEQDAALSAQAKMPRTSLFDYLG